MLALLVLLATSVSPDIDLSTPRGVVEEFCRLDAAGGRLSSVGYESFLPLVAWPAEPGWDAVVVIRGLRTSRAVLDPSGREAAVTVVYDVVGVIGGDSWYPFDSIQAGTDLHKVATPEIVFKLRRDAERWKLVGPLIHPRVQLAYMTAEIRYQVDEARHRKAPRLDLEAVLGDLEDLNDGE